MTDREYIAYKQDILKRKTMPFHMANPELAIQLFERFRREEPTAVMFFENGAQIICYDERAVKKYKKKLLERHKKLIEELNALDKLIDSI